MGRPRRVVFEKFSQYDKLHTERTKMYSGVDHTTLYPIKETEKMFQSIEVWAFCASKFKVKKRGFRLSVDIPVVDDKTADFLKKNCWEDWISKKESTDIQEALALLDNIFPSHKKLFFYDLKSLISSYLSGDFISFDKDGNEEGGDVEIIKYYLSKYDMFSSDKEIAEIAERRDRWVNCKGTEEERERYLEEYFKFKEDWLYEHRNITDVFIDIGKNSVCYPVAFSKGTAEWAIEEYGKPMKYSNAGEIFFVVTEDTVYFEIKRHY